MVKREHTRLGVAERELRTCVRLLRDARDPACTNAFLEWAILRATYALEEVVAAQGVAA